MGNEELGAYKKTMNGNISLDLAIGICIHRIFSTDERRLLDYVEYDSKSL